ncbi:hypothetical protein WJX72_005225 [[Myrmecia] bisecta]|uniref:phosphatidylinositol N-acetylglucosaminyltransferase n=1 Tax=[Myrmecia] bisecta TaxID=41462 RepID=A0AAW1QBF2_9CHLO
MSVSRRVLLVSDFFYPNPGGVENHIDQLAQCLVSRGHKAVILTHAYEGHAGWRYLSNDLKVYYAPRLPFYSQVTFPTIFGSFRLLRAILIGERIDLVHAHQSFSVLAHESILHARTMGYKVVFTDHSLFGFADGSSILTNKLLKFTLADVHQVICVSHTSKENTVLRACVPPGRVSVIPNAVDTAKFWPSGQPDPPDKLTIVALSRMVYRKGIDLLNIVIPEMLARHPNLHFVIGGDGAKLPLLKATIQRQQLAARVEFLGAVPHQAAREVLVRGQIFVNASLTEAFCMAIVEAAAAGLLVVSTSVGGVPEVLPAHMIELAEPTPSSIIEALEAAIQKLPQRDPWKQHAEVQAMYSWPQIAQRTERVYDAAAASARDDTFVGRLKRYHKCGRWFGKICCCVAAVDYMYWCWLDWLYPANGIAIAPDTPYATDNLQETSLHHA